MTTEDSLITDELKKAIGVESEPRTHEVERGAVIRFAQAIGDPNPIYQEDIEARHSRYAGITTPPTFLRSLPHGPQQVDVQSPLKRSLDGGSDWEFFEPIHIGDRITVTNRLVDVVQRTGRLGPMIIMIRETRYVNHYGQLVATQRATGISY